jgi:imidazolonepropionase-like amidohydrolase
LIEFHSHFTSEPSLQRALRLGVTTAHTIATPTTSPDLARRSNDPEAAIPRLLLTTGLFGEFPEHIAPGSYEVKRPRNPDEARRDVQELRLRGATALKIWQDDGELWFGEARTFPPIPDAVLREIVSAGHEGRVRVYAHAWKKRFARVAIDAGVDSLIHPVADGFLEDGDFDAMRRKGVAWTTTMAVVLVYGDPQQYARRILSDPILRGALTDEERDRFEADQESANHPFHEVMPELAEKRDEYLENIRRNTLRARQAGVPIALGSDEIIGIGTHIEMELLQEMGLRPLEVLELATRGSADALGLGEALGKVAVGRTADLLVLDSDPAEDVRSLRDVAWVIKGGHPFRIKQSSSVPTEVPTEGRQIDLRSN